VGIGFSEKIMLGTRTQSATAITSSRFYGQDNLMSQSDLRNEIDTLPVEPLLPVEKKLIGWSLGLGIALLVVLIAINHFVPITL
jgi:hypothetical protein